MRTATSSSSRYSAYSSSASPTIRSSTTEHRSTAPPSSRSSEWLSSYDEVWEDGTGVEYVEGAQPQSIDYYYLPDTCLMAPVDALTAEDESAVSGAVLEEASLDTASFPPEWFGSKRRRVEEAERICSDEERQEGQADPNRLQDALVTVSRAAALVDSLPSPLPVVCV